MKITSVESSQPSISYPGSIIETGLDFNSSHKMQCTNLIALSFLLNIQRFLLTPSLTDDEKEDETANDRVKLGSILGAAFTFWR